MAETTVTRPPMLDSTGQTIATAESTQATQQTTMAAKQTDIATAQASIATAEGTQATKQTEIATSQASIATAEGTQATQQTTMATKLTGIDTSEASQATAQGNMVTQMSNTNTKLDDVINKLGAVAQAISSLATDGEIYGFIEHCDITSPENRIEYIGKNVAYTRPLRVNLSDGSYDLGDWVDFPIIKENKPWMVKSDGTPDYRLDENDYTKKMDGSASDVANTSYAGGAFSWIKKIYKRERMVGNDRYVEFCFEKKDGFEAVGFTRPDGQELSGRWLPMFYATVVDGVAKSIAAGNCTSGTSKTTDQQNAAVLAFNANARFFGGSFAETMIDLMMMFAKNSDLQEAYGYGNCNGYVNDASVNYGTKDNQVIGGGQFYGTGSSTGTNTAANKAFHSMVLNTYNVWLRDPYEVVKNGEVMVSKNYAYDPTGATYTDTGVSCPDQSSNNWRYTKKYVSVQGYGSVPDISVGGASTALGRADGVYTLAAQSGSVAVCLRLGGCGIGLHGGLSARDWNSAAGSSWWGIGFALLLDGSVV